MLDQVGQFLILPGFHEPRNVRSSSIGGRQPLPWNAGCRLGQSFHFDLLLKVINKGRCVRGCLQPSFILGDCHGLLPGFGRKLLYG